MSQPGPGRKTSITLHAQALALQEEGIPIAKIREATELSVATIYCIKKIAFERGYDPKLSRELRWNPKSGEGGLQLPSSTSLKPRITSSITLLKGRRQSAHNI